MRDFKYFFKIHLRKIVILGLLLFLTSIIIKQCQKEEESTITLPDISMLDYSGNLFELDKLDKVEKTIVFFFSPDCDHCEEEIKELLDIHKVFDIANVRWLFITMDVMKDELDAFLESYPIDKKPNVYVLLDKGLYYHNLFEVAGSPYVFIFDKSNKMVHRIIGSFNTSSLMQWIEIEN